MNDSMITYRPPMEADSLIVQVTQGCAHNKCVFCTMYKDRDFKIHKIDQVIGDLKLARMKYRSVKKIFLADGDAFVLPTDKLERILDEIALLFPECEHVAAYSRFTDVIRKSPTELSLLKQKGLKKLYLGLESGCNDVLELVQKNSSVEVAREAMEMLKEAKIERYLTVLLGAGGSKWSRKHINDTADFLNVTNPDFIGVLTLVLSQGSDLEKMVGEGRFEILEPEEYLMEAYDLVKKLDLMGTEFRMNHVSNFINIVGKFPQVKEQVLQELSNVMGSNLEERDQYRWF